MIARILSKIVEKSPLRWQVSNKVTRIEAIQRCIDALGAKRYLEIGVDSGVCFSKINAPEKIGVDPVAPKPLVLDELKKPAVKYFALTSDEFFTHEASRVLSGGVDVVFIDGLHTYGQTYRDCLNSIRFLNPVGVILLHDCLPKSESQATPAESHKEAAAINGPSWDGYWTGDSWKAIVALRAMHDELSACVLDCDQGLGFVHRAHSDLRLNFDESQIAAMTYSDLVRDKDRLLGLRKPAYLLKSLARLRRLPA